MPTPPNGPLPISSTTAVRHAWPTASRRSRTWPTSSACTPKCQTSAVNSSPRGFRSCLEKPGAAAVADLAAVRDEADAAGVPATVALVQRYGPLPDLFGRVGDLRHVRFSFVAGPPSRYVDAGCSWVLDRSVSGGGCLYLLGVHFTDMLRHVTGEEITEARSVRQYPDGAGVEDYGVLTLETSGGVTATVEIGWTFPVAPVKRYVNYTAVGAGGHVAVDTAAESSSAPPVRTPSTRPSTSTATPSTRSSSLKSPRITTTVSPACPP